MPLELSDAERAAVASVRLHFGETMQAVGDLPCAKIIDFIKTMCPAQGQPLDCAAIMKVVWSAATAILCPPK